MAQQRQRKRSVRVEPILSRWRPGLDRHKSRAQPQPFTQTKRWKRVIRGESRGVPGLHSVEERCSREVRWIEFRVSVRINKNAGVSQIKVRGPFAHKSMSTYLIISAIRVRDYFFDGSTVLFPCFLSCLQRFEGEEKVLLLNKIMSSIRDMRGSGSRRRSYHVSKRHW